WIGSTTGAGHATSFDNAAALAFPLWSNVVGTDFTVVTLLRVQTSLRSNEVPRLCDEIPFVDLNSLRVRMKRELVSFLDLDGGTLLRQLRSIVVVECEGG